MLEKILETVDFIKSKATHDLQGRKCRVPFQFDDVNRIFHIHFHK